MTDQEASSEGGSPLGVCSEGGNPLEAVGDGGGPLEVELEAIDDSWNLLEAIGDGRSPPEVIIHWRLLAKTKAVSKACDPLEAGCEDEG